MTTRVSAGIAGVRYQSRGSKKKRTKDYTVAETNPLIPSPIPLVLEETPRLAPLLLDAVSRKHAASRIITLGVSETPRRIHPRLNALSLQDLFPPFSSHPRGIRRSRGHAGIRGSTPPLLYDQESVQPASPTDSQPASQRASQPASQPSTPATPWNIDM